MNPKPIAYDFIENFGKRTEDQNEEVLDCVRKMSYRSAKSFMYIVMNFASYEIKKFMFDSESISDYIYENEKQLHYDIINEAKPKYKVVSVEGDKVFIVDLGTGNITVTCGSHYVCMEVDKEFGNDKRIIYRDDFGNWDEIKRTPIKFVPYEEATPECDPLPSKEKENVSVLEWPEGTEYLSRGPFFRSRKARR